MWFRGLTLWHARCRRQTAGELSRESSNQVRMVNSNVMDAPSFAKYRCREKMKVRPLKTLGSGTLRLDILDFVLCL